MAALAEDEARAISDRTTAALAALIAAFLYASTSVLISAKYRTPKQHYQKEWEPKEAVDGTASPKNARCRTPLPGGPSVRMPSVHGTLLPESAAIPKGEHSYCDSFGMVCTPAGAHSSIGLAMKTSMRNSIKSSGNELRRQTPV
jgi:hypothetical protein